MHEGVVLALIAFCYAAFIAYTSMAVSMGFGARDLLQVGHAIVLVVFCGGGLGFIAWTKQHFGHPLVNVACSLASLGCVSTLVKEGAIQAGHFSNDKVSQILIMVIMGISATTLVNFVVLPVKARRRLHKDLVKDTELLGEPPHRRQPCTGRQFAGGDTIDDLLVQLHEKRAAIAFR